ncbi:MAG: RNA methyltransferase [Phycisphaerales bacterium]|nr:RNA methyltransferase [Phycisphaerales bacterium]
MHGSRDPVAIVIDDADDDRLEVFRDVREKDLRGRRNLFIGESEMIVRRLLRTPERLHALLLTPQKFQRLRDALVDLPPAVPVYLVDLDTMGRIAGFHVHRGVLAAGIRPTREALTLDAALGHLRNDDPCTLVIAEGLTNVDNIGALFRNAAAFGVDGIVLDPACCDPLYRKAIRVSMGHTLSTPYAVAERWPADLDRLREEWNIAVYAAEVMADSSPVCNLPTTARDGRCAFVFGAESTGVSPEVLARCAGVFHIPMAQGVPSLNVAVASAVMLYELRRDVRD